MKLYCGTYKKYNEGSLDGAWMDLDEYEDADAFYAACKELHKDEDDPEFKKCGERYCGMYDSGEDFARELFEECHSAEELKGLEWILRYVDWSAVWRDMSFEGYHEENGYIFDDNR